ncbi:MAG: DNA repair protein RadC [Nitratireductor sp.]
MRNLTYVENPPPISASSDDYLLLKKLISPLRKKREGARIARELLERFGGIGRVLQANETELRDISGFGPDIADVFSTSRQIACAISRVAISTKPLLGNHEAVFAYCRTHLAGERREQFHILHLDKSYRLIAHECLQIGTVDHVTVYPREVMHRAITHGSSAIVLVHNHPSSNPRPSTGDIAMTQKLVLIGQYMGIRVADHIIIGESGNYSFGKNGLLCGGVQS